MNKEWGTFVISVKIFGCHVESDVAHQFPGSVVNVQQLDQVKEIVVHHNSYQVERL